jgi:hypothetical protein
MSAIAEPGARRKTGRNRPKWARFGGFLPRFGPVLRGRPDERPDRKRSGVLDTETPVLEDRPDGRPERGRSSHAPATLARRSDGDAASRFNREEAGTRDGAAASRPSPTSWNAELTSCRNRVPMVHLFPRKLIAQGSMEGSEAMAEEEGPPGRPGLAVPSDQRRQGPAAGFLSNPALGLIPPNPWPLLLRPGPRGRLLARRLPPLTMTGESEGNIAEQDAPRRAGVPGRSSRPSCRPGVGWLLPLTSEKARGPHPCHNLRLVLMVRDGLGSRRGLRPDAPAADGSQASPSWRRWRPRRACGPSRRRSRPPGRARRPPAASRPWPGTSPRTS